MNKINVKSFNKTIFNKGKFNQLIVSPYSGDIGYHYNQVIVISDQVSEPTWLFDRKNKLALILPHDENIYNSVKKHYDLLSEHTRVHATYFTIMDFETQQKLFSVA